MGAGKGGQVPVDSLIARYGHNGAVKKINQNFKEIQDYLRSQKSKNACFIIDTMQVIESRGFDVIGGRDIAKLIRRKIEQCCSVEMCNSIISVMDKETYDVTTKDMVYFILGSPRRIGVKMMKLPNNRKEIIITDTMMPMKDEWKSMKMNPELRKQVNWYFPTELSKSMRVKSDQWKLDIIFDNYVKKEDLFGVNVDKTPYFELRNTYCSGLKTSAPEITGKGSLIPEGELAMQYHIERLSMQFDAFVCLTSDQDIIPITFLNNYRTQKDNIYLVMPRKTKPKGQKTWKRYFYIIDVKKMIRNIQRSGKSIIAEIFLLCMGGCDFFDKPLPRIGYKGFIHKEFLENYKIYKNIVKLIRCNVNVEGDVEGDRRTEGCPIVHVNLKIFKKFIKNVCKRKAKNNKVLNTKKLKEKYEDKWKKNYKKFNTKELFVIPRQFMFMTLRYMNVPLKRLQNGDLPIFDPLAKDSEGVPIWGYEMKNVDKCFVNPVCCGSKRISMNVKFC